MVCISHDIPPCYLSLSQLNGLLMIGSPEMKSRRGRGRREEGGREIKRRRRRLEMKVLGTEFQDHLGGAGVF